VVTDLEESIPETKEVVCFIEAFDCIIVIIAIIKFEEGQLAVLGSVVSKVLPIIITVKA
jgi:hypothetical protein